MCIGGCRRSRRQAGRRRRTVGQFETDLIVFVSEKGTRWKKARNHEAIRIKETENILVGPRRRDSLCGKERQSTNSEPLLELF